MSETPLSIVKLNAALSRNYFRTMDLFAGCGGFTLGFNRADFRCVSAVEKDSNARESHSRNFSTRAAPGEYQAYDNIVDLNPAAAVAHLLSDNIGIEEAVDVIIGGPPCQAYSGLGRAALWRLENDEQAHIKDERASLFQYFLKYVEELQPIAFVMENVPEIGRFGGNNIAEKIAVDADTLGYETRYALLNAVWYGVPQLRERMIIIGIRKELNLTPEFPHIKHIYNLPSGYDTSRSSAGQVVVLQPSDHYVAHGTTDSNPFAAVSVSEAFADLPKITYHLAALSNTRKKRKDVETPYAREIDNPFVNAMRNWPSFSSNGHVKGQMIRHTPRDYETFRRLPENGMYPEALRLAEERFLEQVNLYREEHGIELTEDDPEWKALRKAIVPPYKVHRYPNKFRKLAAKAPSHTVAAHLGKDTYSHIHFDSEQARGISVREAARLQSFPDAFTFVGGMNAQFTQIGNAVPPLMAYAIACTLKNQLESADVEA